MQDAPAEPVVDSTTLDQQLAAAAPLTDDQVAGFTAQFAPEQCDRAGVQTRASAVFDEALRWALISDDNLRKHPDSFRYTRARFAWYLRCIQALGQALARAQNQANDLNELRDRRERDARVLRNELLDAFESVAGSDEGMNRDLDAARGTSRELVASLRALASCGAKWLAHADAPTRTRIEACKLTQGDLDGARRTATALEQAQASITATPQLVRDTPEVNRVEGRVLLEMRELKKYTDTASAKNPLVRKLVPTAATATFFRAHRKDASDGEPSPTGTTTPASPTETAAKN